MKTRIFFVFLALLVVLVGCQMPTPGSDPEIEQLKQQNQLLSQQLLEAEQQALDLQAQVATLTAQIASWEETGNPLPTTNLTPEPQVVNFDGLTSQILPILMRKDYGALIPYVHPKMGLRFSPYGYINVDSDLVFWRDQIANFGADQSIYTWGSYAGSGQEIMLTIEEYWNEFVTPRNPAQDLEVLTDPTQKASNSIDNFYEIYPEGAFTELIQVGTETYGFMDWNSLRFGYLQDDNGAWYLVALIHDEWTP